MSSSTSSTWIQLAAGTAATACAAYYFWQRQQNSTKIQQDALPTLSVDEKMKLLGYAPFEALRQCQTVYHGAIVHSETFDTLEAIQNGLMGVDAAGKICFVIDLDHTPYNPTSVSEQIATAVRVVNLDGRLLCPGFVDAHAHAPQHAFTGTGMDLSLLEWLQQYTFPHESKFSNLQHASMIYERAVTNHLRNGSTTVSYFATIHLESCKLLVDIVRRRGQRALVGKVNMDRNSPDDYVETTESSLRDTRKFVDYVESLKDSTVQAVITPRFVPTCTPELMRGLGSIAAEHKLPIQSHMGETVEEYAWVRALHPESTTYADVYVQHGLMPMETPVYMAHCIHCGSGERSILKERGCGVIHCPNSNFTLGSGICNVRQWMDEGHVVGLGTDVAGGYSPSMLDAIRNARVASVAVSQVSGRQNSKVVQDLRLTYSQLFYLATLGGARAVGLGEKVGNFEVGKDFDALVINTCAKGSPTTVYEHDDLLDQFQKFLFLGDDRNIEQVLVQGRRCCVDGSTTLRYRNFPT